MHTFFNKKPGGKEKLLSKIEELLEFVGLEIVVSRYGLLTSEEMGEEGKSPLC